MIKKALHVGCSTLTLKHAPAYFQQGDWSEIRYDIDPAAKPDILGTITDMHRVSTASMDAVYSSHNLEHVFPHEVALVLSEFKRVLKPNGMCVVGVPDLQAVAKLIANDKLEDVAYTSPAGDIAPLDMLYGLRSALSSGQHYMAHKTGFTVKTLSQYFFAAGFKTVTYSQSHFAINMAAYVGDMDIATLENDKSLLF
jgi:ubiquinone/menaquinone biosynthesis C-methylase UbiE